MTNSVSRRDAKQLGHLWLVLSHKRPDIFHRAWVALSQPRDDFFSIWKSPCQWVDKRSQIVNDSYCEPLQICECSQMFKKLTLGSEAIGGLAPGFKRPYWSGHNHWNKMPRKVKKNGLDSHALTDIGGQGLGLSSSPSSIKNLAWGRTILSMGHDVTRGKARHPGPNELVFFFNFTSKRCLKMVPLSNLKEVQALRSNFWIWWLGIGGKTFRSMFQMQIMEHTAVNRSVHTACKQHQSVCIHCNVNST